MIGRAAAAAVAVVVSIAILAASSVPHLIFVDNVVADTIVRKIGHVAVYGVIAYFGCYAMDGVFDRRRSARLVLLLAVCIAVADEFNQLDVAGRIGSPLDVALDIAGAFAGIAVNRRSFFARSTPPDH